MTVVTTADTSQLYALAARHGLKLHGPLTVNELGLDYRIVIATVDDGRRWVLRIPRRAEVSRPLLPLIYSHYKDFIHENIVSEHHLFGLCTGD